MPDICKCKHKSYAMYVRKSGLWRKESDFKGKMKNILYVECQPEDEKSSRGLIELVPRRKDTLIIV